LWFNIYINFFREIKLAKDTPISLKNVIIYSIYVRNHSEQGNFAGVTNDLERIRSMGVDIIWLMPIHPIGGLHKKGSLGCPYSISDYRSVNPEYGTLSDFQELIDKSHSLGLKVMIDVVYNHTSHDSVLVKEHPEFFHQDANGDPITTVPDWSDVIDLKHPNPGLTTYLIDSLKNWAALGVDGFRCDVASLIPVEFWQKARNELKKVNKDIIWLAESVHATFIEHRRQYGLTAVSDSELFSVFDLTYDYDIWQLFQRVVRGKAPVKRLLEMYRFQHAIYPKNFIKMHCVENHDQQRIQKMAKGIKQALAWTAFQVFNDGAWLIYAGQEAGESHTPSLFDRDLVKWKGYPYQKFLTTLSTIKKHPFIGEGRINFLSAKPVIQTLWRSEKGVLFGLFNVKGRAGNTKISIPDGNYYDQVNNSKIKVKNGAIRCPEIAYIFEVPIILDSKQISSKLLD
jgi:glycosidase